MASTARRNSSRLPVWAVKWRIQGITRRPTTSMKPTKAASLTTVRPRIVQRLVCRPLRRSMTLMKGSWSSTVAAPASPASAGISTSERTMAMSSTISQPTAMRPRSLSTIWRSCRALSSTTVEATESARPKISPASSVQPMTRPSPRPMAVAPAICTSAPGMATARTDSRSLREKWRPTPNIKRITPISLSSPANSALATKPGVNGPTNTPATR